MSTDSNLEESNNVTLGPYIESLNAEIDKDKTLTISFQARTTVAKSGLSIEKLDEYGINRYIGRQFKIVNFSNHGKNTNPLKQFSYSIENVNLKGKDNIWVWINESGGGNAGTKTPRGTSVVVQPTSGEETK